MRKQCKAAALSDGQSGTLYHSSTRIKNPEHKHAKTNIKKSSWKIGGHSLQLKGTAKLYKLGQSWSENFK